MTAGLAALVCALTLAGSAGAAWQAAGPGLPPRDGVLSLAVDAGTPGTVYAGLLRQGIYRSADGGRTWRSVTNFPVMTGELVMTFAVSILALTADPSRPGTVYAGTSFGGLLVTGNGGERWWERNRGLEGAARGDRGLVFSVDALAASAADPDVLYAAIRSRGVYRSSARGVFWAATSPLPSTEIRAIAVHPARPDVAYAGTLGGVFKTVDGGTRWQGLQQGLRSRLVQDVVVHPARPWVVYAATHGGVFRSVNGGRRWHAAGLQGRLVQDVVVHPTRPRTLFAAVKGGGVFRSTDAGRRWHAFNNGLANRLVVSLAFERGRPNVLYAGTLGGLYVRPLAAVAP